MCCHRKDDKSISMTASTPSGQYVTGSDLYEDPCFLNEIDVKGKASKQIYLITRIVNVNLLEAYPDTVARIVFRIPDISLHITDRGERYIAIGERVLWGDCIPKGLADGDELYKGHWPDEPVHLS